MYIFKVSRSCLPIYIYFVYVSSTKGSTMWIRVRIHLASTSRLCFLLRSGATNFLSKSITSDSFAFTSWCKEGTNSDEEREQMLMAFLFISACRLWLAYWNTDSCNRQKFIRSIENSPASIDSTSVGLQRCFCQLIPTSLLWISFHPEKCQSSFFFSSNLQCSWYTECAQNQNQVTFPNCVLSIESNSSRTPSLVASCHCSADFSTSLL